MRRKKNLDLKEKIHRKNIIIHEQSQNKIV
jgi:hypothetical protein